MFNDRNYRKLLEKHSSSNYDTEHYIGELPSGQKVIDFKVFTGRKDHVGRPIFAKIQTVSPDGNYTQLQKDLLVIIESGGLKHQGSNNSPHILSISMLDTQNYSSQILRDGAVDLEILYSSIATALKQVK